MTTAAIESAHEARFRHVVFRGQHSGRVINLAPPPAPPEASTETPLKRAFLPQDTSFIDWLFERCGLSARIYRDETLHRRLPACLRALRVTGAAAARAKLEHEPGLTATALGTMVIGVSSFFRDTSVFDHLRDEVLPALPRRAGHPRVWSIGCSDGQELYSVAMLLNELNLLRGATLLGTDCRSTAVARARQGQYDAGALRDVPPAVLEKYFVPDGPGWRVCGAIRETIQWRTADATRLAEPGAWDLILCRNLAIYLRCEVAAQLRTTCEKALRTGGFLVLGKAERPSGPTRLASISPCIYRKE